MSSAVASCLGVLLSGCSAGLNSVMRVQLSVGAGVIFIVFERDWGFDPV